MIGTQDELLSFMFTQRNWYKLLKDPTKTKEWASITKASLRDGKMLQSTKDRLCKQLGMSKIREAYTIPSVYEVKNNLFSESPLSGIIFGEKPEDFSNKITSAKRDMSNDNSNSSHFFE